MRAAAVIRAARLGRRLHRLRDRVRRFILADAFRLQLASATLEILEGSCGSRRSCGCRRCPQWAAVDARWLERRERGQRFEPGAHAGRWPVIIAGSAGIATSPENSTRSFSTKKIVSPLVWVGPTRAHRDVDTAEIEAVVAIEDDVCLSIGGAGSRSAMAGRAPLNVSASSRLNSWMSCTWA